MSTLAELADRTQSAAELFMTTQRPAGQTATFPLWFVHDGERLYSLAADSSSEVWDVRASNRVMVAIGAPDSEDRLPMQADVMEGDEWVSQMVPLLEKKYGADNAERMARTAAAANAGGHVIIKFKPV